MVARWWVQVAWVYRKGGAGGLPRAHLQADLDILTPPGQAPAEALLAEAEALRAAVEVCATSFTCLLP